MRLREHKKIGMDALMWSGQSAHRRTVLCVRVPGVLVWVGGGEDAALVDLADDGDDVLEVEQIGGLAGGHDRAGRVNESSAFGVGMREHGERAADA